MVACSDIRTIRIPLFLLFCLFSTSLFGQTPALVWAKSAGGTGFDDGYHIAADASGNSYVVGMFNSPLLILGSDTLSNAGARDVYLVKYDPGGNVLWARSAGGDYVDESYSVAVDASGNVFITGFFESDSISFGSTTLVSAGLRDAFVAKYDASGNLLWAKRAGGTKDDPAWSIALDAAGNSYMTGGFASDSISFGSITLISTGSSDMFVVKFDPAGNALWAKSAGGNGYDYGRSIAFDAKGNCYIAGTFNGSSISLGSTTLTNSGLYDVFVARYSSTGNLLWARSTTGTGTDLPSGISVDGSGTCYVTGDFNSSSIGFGSTVLSNAGGYDVFVARYDSSGNLAWAKGAGNTGEERSFDITTDAVGNSFISGFFSSPSLSLGPNMLNNAGDRDILLAKYDGSGNILWAEAAGGAGRDQGFGVRLNGSGYLYATGFFESDCLQFGNSKLTLTGGSDLYVLRLNAGTLTVEGPASKAAIIIFPNPVKDVLTLHSADVDLGAIQIFDCSGRKVLEQMTVGKQTDLHVQHLPKGVYFLKAESGRLTFSKE